MAGELIVVPGKPLGRVKRHDPRSVAYLVPRAASATSAKWARQVPVFDQGDVGSCTGNAAAGVAGTDPFYATLPVGVVVDEALALRLYSAAETIDGDGPYPPNDNGSSGLSVAQAAKADGLFSGYLHITSVAAALTAILSGPFIVGSDWFEGMDEPTVDGYVNATGAVRGGHEYECFAFGADADRWWFWNSWGPSFGVGGTFCYSSATFAKLLSADGDATTFVPITQPAPTPTPAPNSRVVTFTPAEYSTLTAWAAAKHVGSNKQAARAFTNAVKGA